MATSAFGLGKDTGVLLNSVIYTNSIPPQEENKQEKEAEQC